MKVASRSAFVDRRLTIEELAEYREQGYLRCGRVLTEAGVEQMRAESMQAWSAAKADFDPSKSWLQNTLLPNAHHHSKAVRDFYFDGPLVGFAQQIIGPNIKGATSQLTFKMRGNTKPVGWHQDNGYGHLSPYNTLTCLTALDDADQDNGCLWLIPRSNQQGQIEVGAAGSAEQRAAQTELIVDADDSKAVAMPMKAGECLIFSCWTLHKSDGNMSQTRDRRILFLRYADADAVEVYRGNAPRLGRLLRGTTRFDAVAEFEKDI